VIATIPTFRRSNPSTQVVLAVVDVIPTTTAVTATNVVDKRVMCSPQGASVTKTTALTAAIIKRPADLGPMIQDSFVAMAATVIITVGMTGRSIGNGPTTSTC